MFWNEWKIDSAIYSFWDMVDFQSSQYTLRNAFLSPQKMRYVLKQIFEFFFAIFSFWVTVDFVFYLRTAFRTWTDLKKKYVKEAPPSKPPVSIPRMFLDWIPLSYWLSGITGQRFWSRFTGPYSSLRMLNTKSIVSQKIKIAQKKLMNSKIRFRNNLIFLGVSRWLEIDISQKLNIARIKK